jgi:hypothetical protein
MTIADRRGISEEEVLRWPMVRFLMWAHFYGEAPPRL